MFHSFTIADAAKYGDLLVSQHKLRYRVFRKERNWSVPDHEDMEFDQYDNLRTTYLVYVNTYREVLALIRIYPTSSPYMLETLWPQLVSNGIFPKNETIFEATRFCVDTSIVGHLRQKIIDQMVNGLLKVSLEKGITEIVGVTYPSLLKSVFIKRGWKVELLGPSTKIESTEIVVAARLAVNDNIRLSLESQ